MAVSDLDELWDRMMERNPQLQAVANTRMQEVIQLGAQIFAAERGGAPDGFGPWMAAAAAAAAVNEVSWIRAKRTSREPWRCSRPAPLLVKGE